MSLSTGTAVVVAIALLVVGGVLAAAAVLAVQMFAAPPATSLFVGEDGDLAAFDLAVGDCADRVLAVERLPASPATASCAGEHEVEVYAVAEPLPEGRYPDEVALDLHASAWCEIAFERYVGTDYWSSELEMWPVVPDRDAWEAGDRAVACLTSTMDGSPLEGSVAGTGR